MASYFANLIPYFFSFLFFFAPLILFPKTSELFEFNKMILIYLLTVLITSFWIIKMILEKRIIFRRTILDIPLLLFLGSQFLSTIASIDFRTSIFGYYSRFHGGLLSSLSYSLLYWAFVSNINKDKAIKSIYVFLTSAVLISIYGVLEHFGIDKDIWVQDVQNRVFSTLGQPNWLASWLVALIPLTWAFALSSRPKAKDDQPLAEKFKMQNLKLQFKIQNFWIWFGSSILFFLTLLYTKSRSGLLGLAVADFIFWSGAIWLSSKIKAISIKEVAKIFIIYHLSFIIVALSSGTPWTPGLKELVTRKTPQITNHEPQATVIPGPALEVGGTESGKIREIVWRGAIEIWKHYPILGTGVETFAYSYYNFRPVEHNLVSEWDFLYNKAHNEYLNFLATTGTIGLVSYLLLIAGMGLVYLKSLQSPIFSLQSNSNLKIKKLIGNWKLSPTRHSRFGDGAEIGNYQKNLFTLAFFSGYTSILITNFFGFSVVPVALQFFLYPAMAISLGLEGKKGRKQDYKGLSSSQLLGVIIVSSFTLLFFYSICKYWYADVLYAKGKLENDSGNYVKAREILQKSIKLSSEESIFWDELSQSSVGLALTFQEESNEILSIKFADSAVNESDKAINLSPANVNLKRSRASLFIKLSAINPNYLINARETLVEAVKLAPTDAKLNYNLALAYVRTGAPEKAMETLEKTIEMKSDYRNARFAYALLLIDKGEKEKAREQLEYILQYIGEDDPQVKQELDALNE